MARIISPHNNTTQYQTSSITVPLVLHRVAKSSSNVFEDINVKIFNSIVRHIAKGWVTFEDTASYPTGLSRNWLLTFDDGNSSDYEIVFPALKDAGIKAVFFLITGKVGLPGYLSWEQVREMRRHGMEFGSHGLNHSKMTSLNKAQALDELTSSRQDIEDHLGEAVTTFSFPYGDYGVDLIELTVSAGYTACCTSDHGTVKLPAQLIPRNSINSAMRWPAILRTLEPSPFVCLRWTVEDWSKKRAKRLLSGDGYQYLRALVSKGPSQ
jgi:peptidoglycan/xylan/chitin deacetylase (PgdA/CDA1 family)